MQPGKQQRPTRDNGAPPGTHLRRHRQCVGGRADWCFRAEDAIRAAFTDQGLTPLFIGKEAGGLQARVACARDSGAAAIVVAGGDGTVACAARVSGNAEIAEELRYGLNHWDGLTRFLDDGRIDLDTNIVERGIRPIAENWACVASLVETCKVNDVDPQTYFADVLASSSLSGPSRASTNSCPGPGPSRAPTRGLNRQPFDPRPKFNVKPSSRAP